MKLLNIFASICFIVAVSGVSLFADDVTLSIFDNNSLNDNRSDFENISAVDNISFYDNDSTYDNTFISDNASVYDNESLLAFDNISIFDNRSAYPTGIIFDNRSTLDNASTYYNLSTHDNIFKFDNESLLTSDNISIFDNGSALDNASVYDNTSVLADEATLDDENVLMKMCRAKQLTPHAKRYMSLVTDNDAYFNPYMDRYYTAGNRIIYTSPEKSYYCDELLEVESGDNASPLAWISKFALFSAPSVSRWSVGLGQEIFTPSYRIGDQIFQPNYPYGGFLYFILGITNRNQDVEERFTLNIGVVGPLSLGQVFQDFIHIYGHLGAKLNGWDTQLSNEPIFNLQYFLTTRNSIFETKYISTDFLHSINMALGNAHTHAGTSLRLRLGYNLDNDFGVSKLNHATDSGMPHSDRFSVYFFGGIGAKLVAKNIFISGNTFRIGTGLELNNLIYELELGVAMSYKGIRATYLFSRRSKEFTSQKYFSDFGTIMIDVAF